MILEHTRLTNLLEAWRKLVPEEYLYVADNYCSHEDDIEKDCIQAYVQRCIEKRKWFFSLHFYSHTGYISSILKREFLFSDKVTALESLLYAYLATIAINREVVPGGWKHYGGDEYQVIGQALLGYRSSSDKDKVLLHAELEIFNLTEDPTIKVFLNEYADNSRDYLFVKNTPISNVPVSIKDGCNRIFYYGETGRWARLTDSFLGLTYEGQLRFEYIQS